MEFNNKLKREFGSSFSRLSVPYFDLIQTKSLPRKTSLKNAQMQSSLSLNHSRVKHPQEHQIQCVDRLIKSFMSITSTRSLDIVCGQAHLTRIRSWMLHINRPKRMLVVVLYFCYSLSTPVDVGGLLVYCWCAVGLVC